MTIYDFDKQLKQGERGEAFLDRYFKGRGWTISRATKAQQHQGIDRVFRKPGHMFTVEYKADKTAASTGNAFIETVSQDSDGRPSKPGWAYTCQADYLMYYVDDIGPVYVCKPGAIKSQLDRWGSLYREVSIQNKGWVTRGLIVPLDELEVIALHVLSC